MVRYKELDRQSPKEVSQVIQLFIQLACSDAKFLDPRFEMTPERTVNAAGAAYEGSGKILVAVEDDTVVGFIAVNKDMSEVINALFVDPSHRRGGVARQLIKELKSLSPFVALKVETIIGNREAISFYQAAGFIPLTMGLSESGV